jgi:hypothetical protein
MPDEVMECEVMTRAQYARHRKCSSPAVRKAALTGRLGNAVIWGPGGSILGIKWRQADEFWAARTDARQAARTMTEVPRTVPLPAVQTSALLVSSAARQGEISALLARIFDNALIPWAALAVAMRHLSPDAAVDLVSDGLLIVNDCAAHALGLNPENCELAIPEMFSPENRPRFVERIRTVAENFAKLCH